MVGTAQMVGTAPMVGTPRVVIFDLDDTLRKHNELEIEQTIREIIVYYKANGAKIAMASLNVNADLWLAQYKIGYLFDVIEQRVCKYEKGSRELKSVNKAHMFKRIKKKVNVPYEEMLFFDDQIYHCLEAKWLGIKSVLISKNKLLSWKDVKRGAELFSQRPRRNSI